MIRHSVKLRMLTSFGGIATSELEMTSVDLLWKELVFAVQGTRAGGWGGGGAVQGTSPWCGKGLVLGVEGISLWCGRNKSLVWKGLVFGEEGTGPWCGRD